MPCVYSGKETHCFGIGDHNFKGFEVLTAVFLCGAFFIAASILFVLFYRAPLRAAWQDPVLRVPVMNFESDDWSPGPADHALALNRLRALLESCRDHAGHPAVMTLGVILGIPDAQKMRVSPDQYQGITLADDRYQDIRAAMVAGAEQAVFSLQLHGLEHYWPDSLMAATKDNHAVREWVVQADDRTTEELPASVQSRWTDAVQWPSSAHSDAAIEDAVEREVAIFEQVFGRRPAVVVPPTFVWTTAVEEAWYRHGITILVTPGTRFTRRDQNGAVKSDHSCFWNGERGASGVRYMVRNVYFEPDRGHTAESGLRLLQFCTRLGRPCLFETHRSNFIGEQGVVENAFTQIEMLLRTALSRFPDLRFMSTEALAKAIQDRDADVIDTRLSVRLRCFYLRVKSNPKLRKPGFLSGFLVSVYLAAALTGLKNQPLPVYENNT